jgi:uncharacterized RDD family membrane protein YckC
MNDVQESIFTDIIEPPQKTTIGKRIAAALIDGMILFAILIVMGHFFGDRTERTTTTTISSVSPSTNSTTTREVSTSTGIHLSGLPALGYMICWFFLIPFMEGQTGQTLGKKALKIKVIRLNGEPTNIGVSFLRHLFDVIDCFLLIGLIIAASNPKNRRIGDLVAGTYVVALVTPL